jgi:hypothetical protein
MEHVNKNNVSYKVTKLTEKHIKNWIEPQHDSFIHTDTVGNLMLMEQPASIIEIYKYSGDQEAKKKEIEEIIAEYGNNEDVVIITTAYVSTEEFPETEYYDSRSFDKEYINQSKLENKKPVPYDEIISRESKLLESIGFLDFNDYVGYENKKAYIYGNNLGKKILERINSF